jgi:hypothetical protein
MEIIDSTFKGVCSFSDYEFFTWDKELKIAHNIKLITETNSITALVEIVNEKEEKCCYAKGVLKYTPLINPLTDEGKYFLTKGIIYYTLNEIGISVSNNIHTQVQIIPPSDDTIYRYYISAYKNQN